MTGECIDLGYFSVLVPVEFANSWSEHPCTDKCTYSADDMNAVGSRVIVKSPLCKEAAAPGPVRFDRIDERRDDCRIDTVA